MLCPRFHGFLLFIIFIKTGTKDQTFLGLATWHLSFHTHQWIKQALRRVGQLLVHFLFNVYIYIDIYMLPSIISMNVIQQKSNIIYISTDHVNNISPISIHITIMHKYRPKHEIAENNRFTQQSEQNVQQVDGGNSSLPVLIIIPLRLHSC